MVREKFSKLILVSLICLSIMCSYSVVSAKETNVYFTNDNGVSLTKEEYDFLVKMYCDWYTKLMTKKEYQEFNDKKIIEREYEEKTVTYDEKPLTRGSYHETAAKSLKISKACDSDGECFIVVNATWNGVPTVKSYDLMGSYLNGDIELVSGPDTRVSSSEKAFFASDMKKTKNGFGFSFKLPGGEYHVISQSFHVQKKENFEYASIFSSYQHARRETTLEVSQDYKISLVGEGHVFDFGEDAYDVYDHMNGVDIEI